MIATVDNIFSQKSSNSSHDDQDKNLELAKISVEQNIAAAKKIKHVLRCNIILNRGLKKITAHVRSTEEQLILLTQSCYVDQTSVILSNPPSSPLGWVFGSVGVGLMGFFLCLLFLLFKLILESFSLFWGNIWALKQNL